MQRILRYAEKINYTIVLYGIALVGLVYVVSNTKMTEAILAFCFGGIVPGTNKVLEPQVIMTGAAGLIGLILLIILTLWVIRMVEVRRAAKHLISDIETALMGKNAIDEPKAMLAEHEYRILQHAKPVKTSTKPILAPAQLHSHSPKAVGLTDRLSRLRVPFRMPRWNRTHFLWIGHTLLVIATFWHKTLHVLMADLERLATSIGRLFARVRRMAASIAVTGTAAILVIIKVGSSKIKAAAIRLWRWLEPRALQFDSWLEIRYRLSTGWMKRKLKGIEVVQLFIIAADDSINTVRHLFK